MARAIQPLTDTKIKNSKTKDKKYKLSDGGGLFLLIKPNGSKLWRLKYRLHSQTKEYAIGVYPDISLLIARKKREELRELIANDVNINELKQDKKKNNNITIKIKENTFKKISLEWLESYKDEISENYYLKLKRTLELHTYPFIENKAITDVSRLELIDILKVLKEKNLKETANRIFMILNKIFMYATMMEIIPHNITADIDKKVILGKIIKKNYPTFTKKKDIKGLLLSIDEYSGDYSTQKALAMLPYVFARSFNIRHCEWSEIDIKNKQWIIPANKMKVKTNGDFILPLPHQVIDILTDMQSHSGNGRYVFPSLRNKERAMSDNTMIGALRRMGYSKEEIVPHSFRSIFSTIAYENMNIPKDKGGHNIQGEVIESLLAHEERNKVKGAYNRAEYLDSKKELIQWYGNYLDDVRNG